MSSSPPNAVRVPELDGLRGMAVSMVLVWHMASMLADPAAGQGQYVAYHLLRIGRSGVDLFFVLSGFLITSIVLDRRANVPRFLRSFWVRRSLRILPPYLALVAVFWLLVALGMNHRGVNAQTPWAWHLTLTQNWWMATHGIFGPDAMATTWSVAIEEQYYLVAPLLLLWLPRRWVPWCLLLVACGSAAARALHYLSTGNVVASYVLTPLRLDGLALGGLLAWAWADEGVRSRLRSRAGFIAAAWPLAAAGALLLMLLMTQDIAWHMYVWGHLFLAAFYAWALVLTLLRAGTPALGWLRTRALAFMASISYAIYLVHPCIFGLALMGLGHLPRAGSLVDWLAMLAALLASVLLCAASHHLAEQRLVAWGRRFAY